MVWCRVSGPRGALLARANVVAAAQNEFELDGDLAVLWASVQVLVVPVYLVSALTKHPDSAPLHTVIKAMGLSLHDAFMTRGDCARVFALDVGNSWPLASNGICTCIYARFKHVLCLCASNQLSQDAYGSLWAARRPNAPLRVNLLDQHSRMTTASNDASTPGPLSIASSRCTRPDTPAHSLARQLDQGPAITEPLIDMSIDDTRHRLPFSPRHRPGRRRGTPATPAPAQTLGDARRLGVLAADARRQRDVARRRRRRCLFPSRQGSGRESRSPCKLDNVVIDWYKWTSSRGELLRSEAFALLAPNRNKRSVP